jgi:hypothetical protein
MVAFPKSISDLDNCQKVLMYGEELGMGDNLNKFN